MSRVLMELSKFLLEKLPIPMEVMLLTSLSHSSFLSVNLVIVKGHSSLNGPINIAITLVNLLKKSLNDANVKLLSNVLFS